MVGGVITSTILELIIYPAIYMIWRGRKFGGPGKSQQPEA
jgi:copper/silver efflux system protein